MDTKAIETISPEEGRRRIAAGDAQAVDVRAEEAWSDAHVPGAVRIEPDRLESDLDQLDAEQTAIVLADDAKAGRAAVKGLVKRGIDAALLEGGMDAWKDEDFTIQPSHDPDDDAPVEPEG